MRSEMVKMMNRTDREADAVNRRDLLREQVGDGDEDQDQRGHDQADGNFRAADMHIQRASCIPGRAA